MSVVQHEKPMDHLEEVHCWAGTATEVVHVPDHIRDFTGRPINAAVWLAANFEETWLVEDLIPPEGRFLIVAKQKVGKTFLGMQLAWCVASGEPFLGFRVPHPMPVHYIDCEMGAFYMPQRLPGFGARYPAGVKNFTLSSLPDRGNLLNYLRSPPDVKLVVLDPAVVMGYTDENSSALVFQKLDEFHRVVRDMGAALCVVHHARKGMGADHQWQGIEEARGSSAFAGWMDGGIAMRAIHRDGPYELEFTLRGGKQPDNMRVFRRDDLTYDAESGTLGLRGVVEEGVAEWVESHDGPVSKAWLVDRLVAKLATHRATVYRRLKNEGLDQYIKEVCGANQD